MSNSTHISVIIPTRGRTQCLFDTILDLSNQTYKNFDIWVIDQNDQPIQEIKNLQNKICLHHASMPPLGSHAGRNHAIFKTKSEFCLFVDDDVRLEENFLKIYAELLEGLDSKCAAIAGRVIQPKDGLTNEQMLAQASRPRYNKNTGLISGNFIGNKIWDVDHIHECNFIARTAALREISGFNEAFEGNAYYEGADLALRLQQKGYRIIYRPEVSLIHLQASSGGNRVQQKSRHTYWLMRNHYLMNSLHMSVIGLIFFLPYSVFYVVAKSLKNFQLHILYEGIKGIIDGLKYFNKNAVRTKCSAIVVK